ncbi:MAG TPA: helix-turn-helix domain-containing protein [Vicinamibacterales bacterium]|nr:helix-turn-helix domain-containing protein [Vicinamibacterales bacterium]
MAWPLSNRPFDVRLLGSAVLMMSMAGLLISARLAGLAPATAATEHTINLLGLCSLPMLVTYARFAAGAPIGMTHAAWWLPAAGYVAMLAGRSAIGVGTRVPFVWLAPIVCGFTLAAAITMWRHRGRRRPVVVPAGAVIAFVAVLNVTQLIRMEFGSIPIVRAIVPLVMSAGFVAIAAFAVWSTFAKASTSARATADKPADKSTFAKAAIAKPYERSGLDETAARQLLKRIDHVLTRDRLYARIDLTLAQLGAAVDATPHQVSEALNHYAGESFAEVINRLRVEDVKAQLRDPVNDLFTIEGIGLSAGFGSRSALYTAFKRREGVTPTAFRERERKSRW